MNEVVFVCAGNAARSQFAEVLYRDIFQAPAVSAGTEVITGKALPDDVLSVLRDHTLPTEGLYRKPLTESMVRTAQTVILMTDLSLPTFLNQARQVIVWDIADPRGQGYQAHRDVFERIKRRINQEFRGST